MLHDDVKQLLSYCFENLHGEFNPSAAQAFSQVVS